jgi:hypothetical protein
MSKIHRRCEHPHCNARATAIHYETEALVCDVHKNATPEELSKGVLKPRGKNPSTHATTEVEDLQRRKLTAEVLEAEARAKTEEARAKAEEARAKEAVLDYELKYMKFEQEKKRVEAEKEFVRQSRDGEVRDDLIQSASCSFPYFCVLFCWNVS